MGFTIRTIRPTDAEDVHRLSWQLGYEPSIDLVRKNISTMLAHPDYTLVGIVDESDRLLGWMSLAVRIKIEDTSFLQVAAVVTDESARGSAFYFRKDLRS